MLYIGLILSETQILVNLKDCSDIYDFPYFIVVYSSLSKYFFNIATSYLFYIFVSYAFFLRKEKALTI